MALILNGTNHYANGALSVTRDTALGYSYAVTFKTGGVVTGVRQTIACLNTVSGNFRGFSIVIRSDGIFAAVANTSGSDSDGTAPYSNITAQPNTIYRAVLIRSTTNITLYINAIGSNYTRAVSMTQITARIHHGGKYSGTAFSEPLTGKIVRSAFWPSILSNEDITVCLNQLQTPANCSVAPQDYWEAAINDSPTNGSNSLVRMNGATYDADNLYVPSITSITNPISVGGVFSFTGAAWVNNTLESITSNVTGATVSSITGNTTNGSATVGEWVDGQSYAETPCAITLTFNDGIGTDTESITLNPQLGYIKVPINDPILNTSGYLASDIKNQTGRILITGDKIYHNVPGSMSDLVIESDTSYSVSNGGTISLWLWVSSGIDAGKMFEYSINISKTIISINLTACYVQSESPKIDGSYFYSDRP